MIDEDNELDSHSNIILFTHTKNKEPQGFTAPTLRSTTLLVDRGTVDGRTHPWIGDHGDDGDDDAGDFFVVVDDDDEMDARKTSRETRTDGDDQRGIVEKQDDDIKDYSRNVDDDSSVVG